MDSVKGKKDAPTGIARVVRTASELGRLADVILPAYVRGNATVEGYVKLAHRTRDGASLAAERTKHATAQLNVTCLEPIAQVLDTAYGTGQILSGSISDKDVSLAFNTLSPPPNATTRGRPTPRLDANGRGGILAVLALDAEGAPLQRAGTAQPDGRTAVEVARALDRLRQSFETTTFQVELTMSAGGAIIRAGVEATVVVVVEPGVALAHVLSLVPDPATFLGPKNEQQAPDFTRLTTASIKIPAASPGDSTFGRGGNETSKINGFRGAPKPNGVPVEPNGQRNGRLNGHSQRPRQSEDGLNGGRRLERLGVKRWAVGLGQRLDVVKWAVERWQASGDDRAEPFERWQNSFGSRRSESGASSFTRPAPVAIDRTEVENVTTKLLRAAEEYVGPRVLDRLIDEASPGAWAWQNRRVVIRADAKNVPSTDAAHIYREIRGVFGRGAYVSNALRDFNFDAWLSDLTPGLEMNHRSVAQTAFLPEARA